MKHIGTQMKTSWNDGPDQEAVNLNYFILL